MGNNPSESKPTKQSEIAAMHKILQKQQEIQHDIIQQKTQPGKQNTKLIAATCEGLGESNPPEEKYMKSFDMTYPELYCSLAKELDNLLDMLQPNLQSNAN